MCTLTYLPQSNNGFILTSNRDEKLHRSLALPPKAYEQNGRLLLYPKDPQGNGTWLAVSPNGWIACLLNGGLVSHVPKPPYRLSRGLVLLSVFDFPSVKDFLFDFNGDGIEPFTLVVYIDHVLHEIRWTGTRVLHQIKDKYKPHIWSSATLYSTEIIEGREQFFTTFLEQLNNSEPAAAMLNFHQFNGDDRFPHSITIEKENGTKTVSISQILMDNDSLTFDYFDLLQKQHYKQTMPIALL